MTLIAPGVPATFANLDAAVVALARMAARGSLQRCAIEELLMYGYLTYRVRTIPLKRYPFRENVLVVGDYALNMESWQNMRKRMEHAGFVFEGKSPYSNIHAVIRAYWNPNREAR